MTVMGQAPTGMGKTVCFAHMARRLAEKGKRTLIIVHRQELIYQTAVAVARNKIAPAVLAPANITGACAMRVLSEKLQMRQDSPIVISSVQTLNARLSKEKPLPLADAVFVDEAHHSGAKTWKKIITHYLAAQARIIGVTGTPERLDGKALSREGGGIYERLVLGPSIPALVSEGYLAQPLVYAPSAQIDMAGAQRRYGDFLKSEVEERARTITGDAIGHYRKHIYPNSAIAFCASVSAAERLAEAFREAGLRAASVDGTMETEERAALIEGLGSNKIDVLASCDLISEGLDVPAIGGCLMLRPTDSRVIHFQQIGRALRIAQGKKNAIILDHAGNTHRHGHPLEEQTWKFHGGERKKGGGGVGSVRTCEKCYAVYLIVLRSCPHCGHMPIPGERAVPKEVEGELIIHAPRQLDLPFQGHDSVPLPLAS